MSWPASKQVRGEAVPETMRRESNRQTRLLHRLLNRPLKPQLVDMVPSNMAGQRVLGKSVGREDVLPPPLVRRIRDT